MLEKYNSLDVYQDDRCNNLRKLALVLTSFLPLILLFSRAIADITLVLVGFLFISHCIKSKNYAFLRKPIFITPLLLWAWFMFGSLFAFTSTIKAFSVSFVFIRYLLFFFACTNWIFTEAKALRFAVKIITLTVIIAASDALFQFFTGASITGRTWPDGRLTSFLRRPDIGIYLAKLIFPLTAFILWQSSRIKTTLSAYAILSFVIAIIMLTGERTATALSLASIISILFIIGVTNKKLIKYVVSSMVGLFGFFLLLLYKSPFIYKRASDFIIDIGNFSDSLYGQLFKGSILSWKEYGFFTGVGLRHFRDACPTFIESGQETYCDLHSHNIYLEILSESGIIGLALFVSFVILCLYQIFKSSLYLYNKDTKAFVSSVFLIGGLITILFP